MSLKAILIEGFSMHECPVNIKGWRSTFTVSGKKYEASPLYQNSTANTSEELLAEALSYYRELYTVETHGKMYGYFPKEKELKTAVQFNPIAFLRSIVVEDVTQVYAKIDGVVFAINEDYT